MRFSRRTTLAAALVASALATATGCQRDEITHARVAKASPADTGVVPSAPASASDLPPPPQPAGSGPLRWTLPPGWTESVAGGMRYATLKPPGEGKIDASVVVLAGDAGGELANVNRWRGQIGLGPMAEADLPRARKTVSSKLGPIAVYDFTSEGEKRSRVIAGMTIADGQSWFVKMTGDAGPVTAARPEFIHLLESLRLEESR